MYQSNVKKSDAELEIDVINELKWDPSVDEGGIEVSVKQGIVSLQGDVPQYSDRMVAQEAVQRVRGVRAVNNDLQVEIMGSFEKNDTDIAQAAVSAISWNSKVPVGVEVGVENGWITLTGEVEWDYQRNAAREAVSPLMGVCGVTNAILLQSKVQQTDVKQLIEDALRRCAERDAKLINVKVVGSHVTLSGSVHALSEIQAAEFAAWSAPGVTAVQNNIDFAL